jgi:hypothetical protein
MTIEDQVGNPKGLKPLGLGNLEWSKPKVSYECDDEPESTKWNSMESILMYEKNLKMPLATSRRS